VGKSLNREQELYTKEKHENVMNNLVFWHTAALERKGGRETHRSVL